MEKDLALIGVDYRDRFRPGGGASHLTVRRLLVLVDSLDRGHSWFWSEVHGGERLSAESIVLTDIWGALAGEGKIHPLREMSKRVEEMRKREVTKRRIREASRKRKRMRASAN